MNESEAIISASQDYLPWYVTGPGGTDVLFGLVALALVLIVIGFGALYFTIQSIPDRLVKGTSKTQMQIVGLLGLVSLFTMNNLYWVAALLLAAVRLPDLVSLFKSQARSQKRMSSSLRQMEPPGETNIVAEPANAHAITGSTSGDGAHV